MSPPPAGFLQRNRLKLAVAAIILVVLLVGVQLYRMQGGETEKPSGIIIQIITRHDTAIWEAYKGPFLASKFAKDNNIVDLNFIQPDAPLWNQVIDRGGTDVAWGGGPTLFDQVVRDGRVQPLDDPRLLATVAQINDTIGGAPMKRKDTTGKILWVAAAISSFGFTVNHGFLKKFNLPVPQKWEDLASVEYGKLLPNAPISMGNAPQTTSNTRIYEIILQAFGWEKGWSILTRMAANSQIYSGSVETQQAVEIGQVGVAMSIDFYGYTTQLRNPQTEYILPLGQTIINGDPIALVRNAPHKAAAQAFIDFVLNPEGQALWLNDRVNRMPVRGDAFTTELGKKRLDLKAVYDKTIRNVGIDFSDDLALSYEGSIRPYFQAVFTDAHAELVDAWKAIVDARVSGKLTTEQFENLVAALAAPVKWTQGGQTFQFTLQYAQSINDKMLNDSAFGESMAAIWRQAAVLQYAAVVNLVKQIVK